MYNKSLHETDNQKLVHGKEYVLLYNFKTYMKEIKNMIKSVEIQTI